MTWKAVLAVGLVAAVALLVWGGNAMPPAQDAPTPAFPWYLMWAAIATVGIALAAAWLTQAASARPRVPGAVGHGAVAVLCAVAVLGLGEAAVYVAKHPPFGLCRQRGDHIQCGQQPDRPTANEHAMLLFFGGGGVVAILGAAAVIAINRRVASARPID